MGITFACVWTGNGAPYTEEWVQKLQRAIARNYPDEHRFVCLTDRDEIDGVETIKLEHNWPIYWAKMELFKPNQFDGRVIYLDLDVLITGPLTPFVQDWDSMLMITDHFPEIANSTMLTWDGTDQFYHGLYAAMVANSTQIQHDYRDRWPVPNFGDQEFINDWLIENGRPAKRWQDEVGAELFCEFSFKSKINPAIVKHKWPVDMRICYCLGSPKFDQFPDHPLVNEHWI